MKYKWNIQNLKKSNTFETFCWKGNRIPVQIGHILKNRSVNSKKDLEIFLEPKFEHLNDPFLLPGVDEAVKILSEAINENRPIGVYGDNDVDGLAAVSLFWWALIEKGVNIIPYVPDRLREGYGMNLSGIEELCKKDVGIIITVDCGISDVEAVNLANNMGIKVIITDHHQIGNNLPSAASIIHPDLPSSNYPFKDLSGVGVAFKLLSALFTHMGWEKTDLYKHLDLVALGTVADIVPLLSENRILVKLGFEAMEITDKPGIQALMEVSGLAGRELKSSQISFGLAPKINSAGRLGKADIALKLLICKDYDEAYKIALQLEEENRARQILDQKIKEEAIKLVEQQMNTEENFAIVLASSYWHPGVIGIVASRLVESYHRPVVLIAFDEDNLGKGSARSIPEFHLFEALQECSQYLESFGGHKQAAGLVIKKENVENFKEKFYSIAKNVLSKQNLSIELNVEASLRFNEITSYFAEWVEKIGPFGSCNSEPLFITQGARLLSISKSISDFIKLRIEQHSVALDVIAYGMSDRYDELSKGIGNLIDIIFTVNKEQWSSNQEVSLILKDFRLGLS